MNGVLRWLRTPKGQLLVIFAIMLAIVAPSVGNAALVPSLLARTVRLIPDKHSRTESIISVSNSPSLKWPHGKKS